MPATNIFSLPGELRNKIWRELVLSGGDLAVEALCRSEVQKLHQPAVAFVCKQIRNEALSIYYSENSWFLGKIGYHHPKHVKMYDFDIRISRWNELLGPYVRYLARLSMGVDGRCYAWNDQGLADDARYEICVVRKGQLHFERNGEPRCTCRLKSGVEMQATRDGAVLLELVKEYSDSYRDNVHECFCRQCGKSRLEKFGRSDATHLPLWEDIATC
ncbi:hypothetical protein CB0940_10648 [Cercospora beticola]|uniref:F-box domain-containing protein n=1 Tax=Cercospora beticola TaxID=122368 RepID=A0A2G5HU33_CERBT|nr:hypothetical protein CB0940_10648 [Cercospora beticola]PIA96049.1 hypothetical protein CB0940_10648 [Cercospora beticola]WPB07376.1 hypothetical protein RHO25_012037 [Cercospora beticola]